MADLENVIGAAIYEWLAPGMWVREDNSETLNKQALADHITKRLRSLPVDERMALMGMESADSALAGLWREAVRG